MKLCDSCDQIMSIKQHIVVCLHAGRSQYWWVVDNSSHSLLSLSCRGRPVLSADTLQHLMKTVRTALEGSDLDTIIGSSSTLAELLK